MAHDADPHAHPEAPEAPAYVSGTDLGTGASASAFLLGLALAAAPLWVLLAPPLSYTPAPAARATPSTTAPESPKDAPAANLGNLVERELRSGVKLSVPERGVEGRLLAFITDAGRPVDRTTWFDFDRLTFDTGSAMLGPASHDQLSAVASLLAAYPGVKLKIGGYTDNVGDPDQNQKLSAERASSVAAALVGLGVAPDRVSAEGYGEQFPVGDNATAAGRARNRRISMRVTEK